MRIDGSVDEGARDAAVTRFQARDGDVSFFLLSTRAGGLGLNLQAADTVIMVDGDWNPTVDAQALCRAHRHGQTKKVLVFKLMTEGSADMHVASICKTKKSLHSSMLDETLAMEVTPFDVAPTGAVDPLLVLSPFADVGVSSEAIAKVAKEVRPLGLRRPFDLRQCVLPRLDGLAHQSLFFCGDVEDGPQSERAVRRLKRVSDDGSD